LIGSYGKGLAIQVNIEYEDVVNVQRLTVDNDIDWGFMIIVKYDSTLMIQYLFYFEISSESKSAKTQN